MIIDDIVSESVDIIVTLHSADESCGLCSRSLSSGFVDHGSLTPRQITRNSGSFFGPVPLATAPAVLAELGTVKIVIRRGKVCPAPPRNSRAARDAAVPRVTSLKQLEVNAGETEVRQLGMPRRSR